MTLAHIPNYIVLMEDLIGSFYLVTGYKPITGQQSPPYLNMVTSVTGMYISVYKKPLVRPHVTSYQDVGGTTSPEDQDQLPGLGRRKEVQAGDSEVPPDDSKVPPGDVGIHSPVVAY